MFVSKEHLETCSKCGAMLRQDEDVLDTWFSSALWPFSTLGWPDQTEDLKYFYPTSTLVTGYDIIFFWVARMIFSGLEHTGKPPFYNVLFHGLVRDSQGRKMSKSLGNGVDPLKVIEEFGADALRFTLATGNSPGNDMRFYRERVEASRNFANKIWNASRFVLMNLTVEKNELPEQLSMEDKWILNKYNALVQEVTDNLDRFELGIAVAKLYDFIWDHFCDWYIELVKPRLYEDTDPTNESAQQVLVYVLSNTLVLLHPFMPFITEEIWQHLPHQGETIMRTKWPKFRDDLVFPQEDREMTMIMDAIKAIRNIRATMNVPPSRKATVYVKTQEKELFGKGEVFFAKLASASGIVLIDGEDSLPDNCVSVVSDGATMYLPVGELIDIEKERQRLTKEMQNLENEVKRVESKLSNQGFLSKAPEKLVEEERQKGARYREMLEKVRESLAKL